MWACDCSASLTCSGPSPIWQKKNWPEPGPNGLSVSGPVGSRWTCRALQCWSSEPGRLLLKQKGLQGRDIQVVKPYKCGCRGPAGRLTNVWNGHHTVPCPGRGDAPCEMGSDSDGALQPKEEYANVIASTNHLDILCFVTGPPLMQLPKPSKICPDFLYEAERSMHTFRPWFLAVRQGGKARKALWPGYITQPWFQDDLLGPNSRQAGLTERACRSPTCLTDASANSRVVYNENTLRLEDCNGSNGSPFRALSTVGTSQGGTVRGHRGFILLVPRKNWITALSLPTDQPAIWAWKAAMAAT